MTGPSGRNALKGALTALYRADNVSEFVVVEEQTSEWHSTVVQPVSRRADGQPVRGLREHRETRRERLDIALFRDLKAGRGSTRIHLDSGQALSDDRSWSELIADAARRARACLEPAWTLPDPAAPARVEVADADLLRDPRAASADVHRELRAALAANPESPDVWADVWADTAPPEKQSGVNSGPDSGIGPGARLPVYLREAQVRVQTVLSRIRTSQDFALDYWATRLDVDIALAVGDGPDAVVERIRRQTRRRADFNPVRAMATARRRAQARARARVIPAGRYDVILSEDARVPTRVSLSSSQPAHRQRRAGADALAAYGWFAPLVAQADSHAGRRGLTRYQPGQGRIGVRPARGDRLTLVSDGTLPFGLHSRPVGDLGAPTRRFTLIERGVPRGLSLSLREAAVRRAAANGGASNLAIAAGSHNLDALVTPGARPLVRVESLDWLHVDTSNGDFVAAIGVGFALSGAGFRRPVPITGGVMRGNVFELFADARLSTETDVAGWYYGPRWLRFGNIDIS